MRGGRGELSGTEAHGSDPPEGWLPHMGKQGGDLILSNDFELIPDAYNQMFS